jgi:hypothetical protein
MRKGFGRWLSPAWLAGCVALAGCKRDEPPPAPPEVRGPQPAPAASPTPAEEAPLADAGAAVPPAPPVPPTPAPAVAPPPENLQHREWTAGTVTLRRTGLPPVTLRAVRAARNAGFDRVVFEFDGPQLPGYHLEYVDRPVPRCGSGDATEVAGQGWLQVRLTPAQAHTDAGQPTVTAREQKPSLPLLQELELTCDFEGEVTWVLGNARPQPYRVMELREPTRLVVDVRH